MKETLDTLSKFLNEITRPCITLMFVGGVLYGFVATMLSGEAFIGLAGAAIMFWFKQREDEKSAVAQARAEVKAEEKAAARSASV